MKIGRSAGAMLVGALLAPPVALASELFVKLWFWPDYISGQTLGFIEGWTIIASGAAAIATLFCVRYGLFRTKAFRRGGAAGYALLALSYLALFIDVLSGYRLNTGELLFASVLFIGGVLCTLNAAYFIVTKHDGMSKTFLWWTTIPLLALVLLLVFPGLLAVIRGLYYKSNFR